MKLFRLNFPLAGSLLVGIAMVFAGCAAPKINTRSQSDPGVNLASYHTYNFVSEPGTNRGGYSTPITGYFKGAISRELNARGYKLSEDNPELLINFNTNARENVDVQTRPTSTVGVGYGYGYGYYGYRGGMYAAGPINYGTEVETVRYKVGTANIDVVDAAKKQLVWEGIAEGKITDKMMKNPQATIDGVITEMFLNYPVKAGGVTQ